MASVLSSFSLPNTDGSVRDHDQEPVFLRPGDEELWNEIQETTKNAVETQRQLLKKILERNADTEYLRRTELNGSVDEESFKACVPVITYADIEDDIQRIADGDTSPVLCADRVIQMTMSSGTAGGKSKMIPATAECLAIPTKMSKRADLFRNMAFPLPPGSKCLTFAYAGKVYITKGGLRAASGTTNAWRSEWFKNRPKNVVQNFPTSTSPDEVILGYDIRESMYAHLLCGLKLYSEVKAINSIFSYGVAEGLRLLEEAWHELAQDLRTGTVSRTRVTDSEMQGAVDKLLGGPDLEAAQRVQQECGGGRWEGIVPRLWPNAKYVQCILTGAMSLYVPALQKYLGPNLPLVSGDYGASEGWVGSNFHLLNRPEDAVFTLASDIVYLEFIPLFRPDEPSADGEDLHGASIASYVEGEPVGIADIKVGQLYELVFTNSYGLYRYRMADIVKVVGFYNKTPKIQFVCRKNVVLSVNADKTDEAELMKVIGKGAQHLKTVAPGLELVEFTSQVDLSPGKPGSYVIYWELNRSQNLPLDAVQECCTLLDQSFNVSNRYMQGRVAKTIGPLKLRIVREGTFRKIAEFAVSNGGGASQYKTPRCVSSPKLEQILKDEVVHEFESPDLPPELLDAWKLPADGL